jgi:hypothetical protein
MSDNCGHFNVVFNFRLIEREYWGHTAISIMPFGKKQVVSALSRCTKLGDLRAVAIRGESLLLVQISIALNEEIIAF